MKNINDYLKNLSIEDLMNLSSMSDDSTFNDNSIIRKLIEEYELSQQNFQLGVIALRHNILVEITRRYFMKLN